MKLSAAAATVLLLASSAAAGSARRHHASPASEPQSRKRFATVLELLAGASGATGPSAGERLTYVDLVYNGPDAAGSGLSDGPEDSVFAPASLDSDWTEDDMHAADTRPDYGDAPEYYADGDMAADGYADAPADLEVEWTPEGTEGSQGEEEEWSGTEETEGLWGRAVDDMGYEELSYDDILARAAALSGEGGESAGETSGWEEAGEAQDAQPVDSKYTLVGTTYLRLPLASKPTGLWNAMRDPRVYAAAMLAVACVNLATLLLAVNFLFRRHARECDCECDCEAGAGCGSASVRASVPTIIVSAADEKGH